MKICYINGYRGEKSTKPEKLQKLLNLKIDHLKIDYDNLNLKIFDQIEKYDIVIASSLGAYFSSYYCSIYNKELIVFNPVIDLTKTISRIDKRNYLHPKFKRKYSVERLVLLTKDDEILNYKEAVDYYQDISIVVVFEYGGHRFGNIELTKDFILNFLNA